MIIFKFKNKKEKIQIIFKTVIFVIFMKKLYEDLLYTKKDNDEIILIYYFFQFLWLIYELKNKINYIEIIFNKNLKNAIT